MDDVDIIVSHVSNKFCRSLQQSMRYGIRDVSRNVCGLSSRSHRLRPGEFWALDDISFQVKRGEALGLIGPNGSGKSTVLKLINGIMWPDIGKIAVRGKVGALIEVAAGFHPMLTGRENVYLNAAILGMTKKEVRERFDDIIEFAEIGDFIDTPVKYYSSGMFVRLGFAVAIHCDPDVLLVDEVLAVGDISFRRKCFKRLQELKAQDIAWIVVSHDINTIKQQTDRAVLLNEGKMAYIGSPEDAISEYMFSLSASNNMLEKATTHPRYSPTLRQNGADVEVDNVILLHKNSNDTRVFATGEPLTVKIEFTAKKRIEDPIFKVAFYDSRNEICSENFNNFDGYRIGKIEGRGSITFTTPSLPLLPGVYRLDLGIKDKNFSPIVEADGAAHIEVKGGKVGKGMFYMQHSWDVEPKR